jgi:hypothetical protein
MVGVTKSWRIMLGTSSMHGVNYIHIQNYGRKILMGDPGVDGRKMFQLILERQGVKL